MLRLAPLLFLLLASAASHSDEVTGKVHVIDGDSIRIANTEIRLYGIDAPEGKQSCIQQGEDWACGETATEALRLIVGKAQIRCTWKELDRYGRALATCTREGHDIAEMMVDHGVALAYRNYTWKYALDEDEAKAKRMGLWAGLFVPPWDWRRGVRLEGNELPDIDCPVKGNVNSKGDRIYHVKGWRDHAKVRLKPEEGDICFESVFDAELSGFRRPKYAHE